MAMLTATDPLVDKVCFSVAILVYDAEVLEW